MAKKIILSVLLIMTGIAAASAQHYPITIGRKGNTFYYNGVPMSSAHIKDCIYTNTEALKHFNRSKTNEVFAFIFAFTGGAFIGAPLGTAIAGGDPLWYFAGIGAGLIALSIPFAVGQKKQLIRAVKTYNLDFDRGMSTHPDFTVSLSGTPGGQGLTLTF